MRAAVPSSFAGREDGKTQFGVIWLRANAQSRFNINNQSSYQISQIYNPKFWPSEGEGKINATAANGMKAPPYSRQPQRKKQTNQPVTRNRSPCPVPLLKTRGYYPQLNKQRRPIHELLPMLISS